MNNEEPVRDRAYMRHIHVRKEDYTRFMEFISTIPREKMINKIRVETTTHFLIHAKLKKQELLYVQLAFKVVVKKSKARKKKITSIFKT